VLEQLAKESNGWTLDENRLTLMNTTRNIEEMWDTMGWIYFREGKLDEALTYVEAGWRDDPELESGQHVGEVLAARGDPQGALNAYELAMATQPGYNALGMLPLPNEKQKRVLALVEALRARGVKAAGGSVSAELQGLSRVQLGSAEGRTGNAQYLMLLRDGKAVKALPTTANTVEGAEAMLEKANFADFFPAGATMSLVRVGYVNCGAAGCELLLQP
jgi:tetratricopeptide (TPR) repeat protein